MQGRDADTEPFTGRGCGCHPPWKWRLSNECYYFVVNLGQGISSHGVYGICLTFICQLCLLVLELNHCAVVLTSKAAWCNTATAHGEPSSWWDKGRALCASACIALCSSLSSLCSPKNAFLVLLEVPDQILFYWSELFYPVLLWDALNERRTIKSQLAMHWAVLLQLLW